MDLIASTKLYLFTLPDHPISLKSNKKILTFRTSSSISLETIIKY